MSSNLLIHAISQRGVTIATPRVARIRGRIKCLCGKCVNRNILLVAIDFIDQETRSKGTGDYPDFLIDSIRIFHFQLTATMSIHVDRKNAC